MLRSVDISDVVFSYPNVGLPSDISFGFRPIFPSAGILRYFLHSFLHLVTFVFNRCFSRLGIAQASLYSALTAQNIHLLSLLKVQPFSKPSTVSVLWSRLTSHSNC